MSLNNLKVLLPLVMGSFLIMKLILRMEIEERNPRK